MKPEFTLGLCIESYDDLKDPLKAITRAIVADFNIWSTSFSETELLSFTMKCSPLSTEADVVNWKNIETSTFGNNAKKVQLHSHELCGTKGEADEATSIIILPIHKPYEAAKEICTKLGGNFPLVENIDDTRNLNITLSLGNRYDEGGNNVLDICSNRFWMPIRQNGKDNKTGNYLWSEDVSMEKKMATFLPWEFSQPNGLEKQQCVSMSLSTMEIGDYACDTSLFCSLCEFKGSVSFHFHGVPETSLIDRDYILVPNIQQVGSLVFTGYKQYQIGWVYGTRQWQISDRSNLSRPVANFNISQSDLYAIGKHDWFFHPNVASSASVGKVLPLKLSKVN